MCVYACMCTHVCGQVCVCGGSGISVETFWSPFPPSTMGSGVQTQATMMVPQALLTTKSFH